MHFLNFLNDFEKKMENFKNKRNVWNLRYVLITKLFITLKNLPGNLTKNFISKI